MRKRSLIAESSYKIALLPNKLALKFVNVYLAGLRM